MGKELGNEWKWMYWGTMFDKASVWPRNTLKKLFLFIFLLFTSIICIQSIHYRKDKLVRTNSRQESLKLKRITLSPPIPSAQQSPETKTTGKTGQTRIRIVFLLFSIDVVCQREFNSENILTVTE